MGDYDLIIIAALIGGMVLLYIFASSGLLGDGLKDVFSPFNAALKGANNAFGIVEGNQQEGEECEKGKLACGAGLVCGDHNVCVKATASVGERCLPGKKTVTLTGIIGGNAYQDKGGVECESGAHCINNVCYADPVEVGDKCYPNKLKCPSGLRCYPRTGWGECHKDGGMAGDACFIDVISCGEDHTCITPGNSTISGTRGVCTPNRDQAEGKPCKKDGDNTVECGKGLMCVDDVCTSNCKPGTSGQECEDGYTCWPRDGTGKCYKKSNQVEDGVCLTNSGGGKNTIECGTGLACYPRGEGKCRKVTKGAGDFCHPGTSHHFECPGGLTCWPRDGTGKCYENKNQVEGGVCVTKSDGKNTIECGKDLSCVQNKCVKNPTKVGDACATSSNLECPGSLLCWPRDGTLGKCYKNPAGIGEPCIHTGNKAIKCAGDNSIQCSSKKKGHPTGTMGVCEKI